MRRSLGFTLLLVGCSSSSPDHQLPSAEFTPHFAARSTSIACGQDVAYGANTAPDLRYAFGYDNLGRFSHADGVWTADGSTADTLDYTWDGDNLTHMLETWDASQVEITASYDGANLVDYTYAVAEPDYQDAWTYAFSGFVGDYQPTREDISQPGQPAFGYELVYDASNRLVAAIPDDGSASTTWSYDDQALTITTDTGNGAYHGVLAYDDQDRVLSETWGGSDPSMIDGDETFDWSGDQLATISYRSGSDTAPHQVELVSTSTMRYECAMARTHAGTRVMRGGRR